MRDWGTTTMAKEYVQTVQLTSKKWKKTHVKSVIVTWVGIILCLIAWESSAMGNPTQPGVGWIGMFLIVWGIVMRAIGQLGAWWDNG